MIDPPSERKKRQFACIQAGIIPDYQDHELTAKAIAKAVSIIKAKTLS
jgi:hypothetical protein